MPRRRLGTLPPSRQPPRECFPLLKDAAVAPATGAGEGMPCREVPAGGILYTLLHPVACSLGCGRFLSEDSPDGRLELLEADRLGEVLGEPRLPQVPPGGRRLRSRSRPAAAGLLRTSRTTHGRSYL